MPHTYITATVVFASLLLGWPTVGRADPSDRVDPAERAHADHAEPAEGTPRFDYSRFSDGPRRVPTPRGGSLRRATALGLGTRETATALLHRPADPRWVEAAAWRGDDVDRLLWPVDDGNYVRGFGYVRTTRPDLRHDGVDISAPVGTVVRAAADGIVAYSDNEIRGYGNCVLLVHPNGWVTLYAHNSRTTVQAGWRVRRGERIALVGNTGISRGPHLHFELHDGGRVSDPVALFDGGPAFVRRVAARAFRAGRVAEPQAPTRADLPTPPELAPFARTAEAEVAQDPASPSSLVDRVGGLAVGSRALLRRALRFRPTDAMLSAAGGRHFRNLLWPVRGGALAEGTEAGARIEAEAGAAVRAAADGLVVYAGRDGARGDVVVILHPMGWVTVYASLGEVAVTAGQRIERGEWLGSVGHTGRGEADRLDFELRVDGRAQAAAPLFVQRPS